MDANPKLVVKTEKKKKQYGCEKRCCEKRCCENGYCCEK